MALASPGRHVAEAYSTNDKKNNLKKYSFWAMSFIAFLVFSVGSSGSGQNKKQKRAQKLRNKAETMPEMEVQKLQNINKKVVLNEKYAQLNDAHVAFEDDEDAHLINGAMEDEEDLDREVEKALSGVDMAEEDEIDTNNSMLTTAVQTMEESVKFYLGKVFGYGEDEDDDDDDDDAAMSHASADIQLSEEQLDMITKKIADRLERDVKTELRARADSVREEKERQIDIVLAEDKKAQMNAREIVDDVHQAQAVFVEDLKDEIDEAATRVKESLPEKVKKIRNEVVKEVTGKKLDDIEQWKRERKERKQELVKRFHENQVRGKEAAKDMQRKFGKANGLKKGQGYRMKESKPRGDERPRRPKPRSEDELIGKKKSTPQGEKDAVKKNKIQWMKESKPRGADRSRRSKPGSEESSQDISREKSEASEDEDEDEDDKSEASEDEDEDEDGW